MTITVASYAAASPTEQLAPLSIERRTPGADDVAIDILFCGVCHSDLHQIHNDWNNTVYPCVPGHEIVGRVKSTGNNVTRFSAGDLVAVGCIVDSCRTCDSCEEGLEQYCETNMVSTYNGKDTRHGGGNTYGGYSTHIVVDQNYILKVPENLEPATAAPLLCAGITSWSPIREWNVRAGQKVGIIGLGGLGHMGVKFANALGAHVVMITTSPEKGEDALRLGAHEVLVSKDKEAMMAHAGTFDFLLDTVPVKHPIDPYQMLLKRDGTLALVGASPIDAFSSGLLALKRRRIVGSLIGGIAETQEMLDFCGEHDIGADIEMIDMQDINHAFERMEKNDIKYRFVIDMASMQATG